MPALDWAGEARRQLEAMPDVRILTRSTATGRYDGNLVLVAQQQRPDSQVAAGPPVRRPPAGTPPGRPLDGSGIVRTKSLVVATGAIERPIVFAENDLPGIMLAGAARTYMHRSGVAAGRAAVDVHEQRQRL